MSKIASTAAVAAVCAALVAACGGPAQQGTVTRWQYEPPASQTVNTSCSWWSGSSSKSGSGSAYCIDWNTAVEPEPQQCTLTLSDGAKADLNVGEQQCRAYLGRQWPIGGSAS